MQKEGKQKITKKRNGSGIFGCDYKVSRLKKTWVDKGTKVAGEFNCFCQAEKIEYYSTRSETKAAFAERTILSWKNLLCRYMEDYGYKEIHKLTRFVRTLNSRKIFPIDLLPRKSGTPTFCPFGTATISEKIGIPSLKLMAEFASRCMTYLF